MLANTLAVILVTVSLTIKSITINRVMHVKLNNYLQLWISTKSVNSNGWCIGVHAQVHLLLASTLTHQCLGPRLQTGLQTASKLRLNLCKSSAADDSAQIKRSIICEK